MNGTTLGNAGVGGGGWGEVTSRLAITSKAHSFRVQAREESRQEAIACLCTKWLTRVELNHQDC